jgi:outer membrane autotransporter protein
MATARGSLGWRHAFGDVVPTAGLAFAGGSAFTVAGVPIAQDVLVVEAGVDLRIAPTTTLGLDYSGQIGSGMSDHALKADLGIRF